MVARFPRVYHRHAAARLAHVNAARAAHLKPTASGL
eukprot:SAG31_NODE_30829_length_375_cov_1.278986_1_plen_35_part_01